MPFAGFENFDACLDAIIQTGKDEDEARAICGFLQARAENVKKNEGRKFKQCKMEVNTDGIREFPTHIEVPVVMTRNGVQNRALKRTNDIRKWWWTFRTLPITNQHPEGPATALDIEGFTTNEKFDAEIKGITGTGIIPKTEDNQEFVNNIINGNTPDVSIGFYCDEIDESGVHTNDMTGEQEEYDMIETNFKGDHLAMGLGPGQGACSQKDGCGIGLGTNLEEGDNEMETDGANLARVLNSAIDNRVTEQRSRADIVDALASAAGIDDDTVNKILRGGIICPPLERLSGFARVLNLSAGSLRRAAERDGCRYNQNTEDEGKPMSEEKQNVDLSGIEAKLNTLIDNHEAEKKELLTKINNLERQPLVNKLVELTGMEAEKFNNCTPEALQRQIDVAENSRVTSRKGLSTKNEGTEVKVNTITCYEYNKKDGCFDLVEVPENEQRRVY